MNPTIDPPANATLPDLEQALVKAAVRRYTAARPHRWLFPVAFVSALAIGGAAVAASGILGGSPIDRGQTPKVGEDSGAYAIRVNPKHADPERPICLQLRFEGSRPAYGCGTAPTAASPFGVVVADGLSEQSSQRIIYGLVSPDIAEVSSLGDNGTQATVATVERPELPGRYFSLTIPNEGQIELVGLDAGGAEIARIGSREKPDHPPLSREEAVAQGDPSGFAATVTAAGAYTYEGRTIDPDEAMRRNLVCVETRSAVTCFDSTAEAQAFSDSLD